MLKQLLSLAAVCAAVALPAQSPLTTIYAGGNGLGGNTAVYFDLTVNLPVLVNQIDVNALGGTGASSIEFWTAPTTWVGNDANPAAWTLLGSSASVTASPAGTPTVAAMTAPFPLAAGSYGVAIVYRGTLGPAYTNGSGANQTYSVAEMTLQAGASGGIFTGAVNNPRVWNGSIHFTNGGSGTVATRSTFGTGCVAVADTCFYESFPGSAAFDLGNTSMSLLHTGSGYLALAGLTAFRPTTTATALTLTDDSETTVALSAPLKFGRAGSTSSLTVCSNGYVSVASGNGTGFTPTVATFLNAPRTGWWCWHDFNPAAAGSGQVKFEEAGGVAYITWDGVYDFGGTSAANANTFQLQLELATGTAHFVWQTMSGLGGGHLVGFSEGGVSADPGTTDISAALPTTFNAATFAIQPIALVAAARPLIGTTINLDTSNIGASAPFGAIGLGLSNPAFDLTSLGMAGCTQYSDNLVTVLFLPFGAANVSTPFNVPSQTFAIGVHFMCQSYVYDPAAGLTQLGAVASNGVDLGFGNL